MTQRTSPLRAGRKVAVVATDGVEEIELNTVLHESTRSMTLLVAA